MKTADLTPPTSSRSRMPKGIWALGFVSMFMDISSEMIHALLPIYMVTVIGTSVLSVGLIEGIAEATASITKIFSGALSDRLGKRKLLAVVGYGLGALTKPVFPLAGTLDWLVGARFVDRVGKGIRGAPRDALVADITPPELRGAAYGLRQTLDTIGAFMGPLLAIGLMWLTASHFQLVFWIAVLPAFIAIAILVFCVKEPVNTQPPKTARFPLRRQELGELGRPCWWVIGVAVLFTLARFSEAFLILRAESVGLTAVWAPLILVVMGVAYSLSAYPAGALSDRVPKTAVLAVGVALLVAANLVMALVPGIAALMVGVFLWGLHMGFTQGVFAALIAAAAPATLRGTAFGMFHLLTGVALLIASLAAGALWDAAGFQATFLYGTAVACVSLVALSLLHRRLRGAM